MQISYWKTQGTTPGERVENLSKRHSWEMLHVESNNLWSHQRENSGEASCQSLSTILLLFVHVPQDCRANCSEVNMFMSCQTQGMVSYQSACWREACGGEHGAVSLHSRAPCCLGRAANPPQAAAVRKPNPEAQLAGTELTPKHLSPPQQPGTFSQH